MDRICILMATYNGEKFVRKQIDSILNQKKVDFHLLIRDDGSKDNTINIIKEFLPNERITLLEGENLGSADCFYELMKIAPECDYYAFADQDDIWLEDKCYAAIKKLKEDGKNNVSKLYYGNNILIDENDNEIAGSSNKRKNNTFASFLADVNTQGSTIVFNNILRKKQLEYRPDYKKVGFVHDSWLAITCLALSGIVIYDSNPYLLYRKHSNNTMRLLVPERTIFNQFQVNVPQCGSRTAKILLDVYGKEMSKENKKLAYIVANNRNNLKCKLKLLFSTKIVPAGYKRIVLYKLYVLFNRI